MGGSLVITVKDTLNLPQFRHAEVRAGKCGLGRRIHWAHVIDHEDVGDYLEGGELLLNCGQMWPVQKETENKLFKAFLKNDIAGIVFAVGRYLTETPQQVLEFGETNGIPVLEVPFQVSFEKAIQWIHKQILQEEERGAARRRDRSELLRLLLEEPATDGLTIEEKVQALGLNPRARWMAGLVLSGQAYTNENMLHWRDCCQRWIDEEVETTGFCEIYREQLILMVSPGFRIQEFESLFTGLYHTLVDSTVDQHPSLVMGRIKQGMFSFAKSYTEAKVLAPIVRNRDPLGGIYFADQLQRELLLYGGFAPERAQEFRRFILPEELLSEKGQPLYETLKCLVLNGYNREKVADILHIHRNTLRYRIRRIEDLLKDSLSSPQCQFWIRAALDLESVAAQSMVETSID